jgi:putative selenium metabolism protein SsnA
MKTLDPVFIHNATILTFGPNGRVIPDGAVLIRDGVVDTVGPRTEVLLQCREIPALEVIDGRGCVVTPGLINAHMHLYSTFACGIAAPASRNFPEILENLWWRLDRALGMDDTRLSALVPAIRCLKAGVTTIVDHHASYGGTLGSLRTVAAETRRVGLRACLAYEVSDRWGERDADEGIRENADFLQSLAGEADPDLAGLFGLHASMTLSEATLARCREAARGAGFHVHCAEDVSDVEDARRRGFAGVVDRLHRLGILGPNSIAGHCIHVSPAEISTLAETRTIVVTNPQSNMNNAVGCADVPALLAAGCIVGLGSDGMTANILDEMKALILTQRQRLGDPTRMFMEAVNALTVTNPAIASSIFGRPLGVLEPGAAGDAVVWDYDPATPLEPTNAAGHVVFGIPNGRPRTVVASGRVVVREGRVTGVDEDAVHAESRALAAAFWKRW